MPMMPELVFCSHNSSPIPGVEGTEVAVVGEDEDAALVDVRRQGLSRWRGAAMRPAMLADAISKLSAIRRALSIKSAAAGGGQTSRAVCSNKSSQRSK